MSHHEKVQFNENTKEFHQADDLNLDEKHEEIRLYANRCLSTMEGFRRGLSREQGECDHPHTVRIGRLKRSQCLVCGTMRYSSF